MPETDATNQPVRCDKNVLLSMYSETWDLYKKEKNLLHRNNSRFLMVSLFFSLMIVALIINAMGRLQEMHLSLVADTPSSDLIFSASFSIVLPLISLIFQLLLLKKWEGFNRNVNELIKNKSDKVISLERALSQSGLIPLELCAAYNDRKNQMPVQTENLENGNSPADDGKRRKGRKKKVSTDKKEFDEFEISQSLLSFFKHFVLFLFIVIILLIVYMGYSLTSTLLFWF